MKQNEKNKVYLMVIARVALAIPAMFCGIFLLAGTFNYWQGWISFGAITVYMIIVLLLFKNKTDLAKERMKPGPGVKWWDKIFWILYLALSALIFIIAVLDGGRFKWTQELPLYVYIISYIMFIMGSAVSFWAMHVNKFFSSRVRIQKDRGQYAVQDGPYKFVRHPGYLGGIMFISAIPLALGSVYGLIPVAAIIISLIIRTHLEDITLQKELKGYREYAKKVRYKIIPRIW